MYDNALRRLVIALIAAAVGLATLGTAQPYGGGETTTPIELRLWQGLDDPTDIAVGARAPDGVWGELGMVPLALMASPPAAATATDGPRSRYRCVLRPPSASRYGSGRRRAIRTSST